MDSTLHLGKAKSHDALKPFSFPLCLSITCFKWALPGLFFVYYRSFQTKQYNFYQLMWKCPSSIRCWDWNFLWPQLGNFSLKCNFDFEFSSQTILIIFLFVSANKMCQSSLKNIANTNNKNQKINTPTFFDRRLTKILSIRENFAKSSHTGWDPSTHSKAVLVSSSPCVSLKWIKE